MVCNRAPIEVDYGQSKNIKYSTIHDTEGLYPYYAIVIGHLHSSK